MDRRLQIGMPFERLIQIRDVRGVMLIVMDLHRQLVDVRFERVERVRKRWNDVGHRTLPR